MMTSINRNYTPSTQTINPGTGKYKTPKPYDETIIRGQNDRKLAALLTDKTKFNSLAGDDGILTVNEAAFFLKKKNFDLLVQKNKEFAGLEFAFDRFANQQRNIALAVKDETFSGVTINDMKKVVNDFKWADEKDTNKVANQTKGFQHFGTVYAQEALYTLVDEEDVNYNVRDGLTNVLNELSSKEESTARTVTNERPEGFNPDDDTSATEKPNGFFNSPIFTGLLGAGVGFLASLFIKK
jgi:hypothetical protein